MFLGHRRNIDRVDDGTNNVVVVAVAEDPVEEHGQPHSPLRDPPRHDGQPRLEVVVCKAMVPFHTVPSASAAISIQRYAAESSDPLNELITG